MSDDTPKLAEIRERHKKDARWHCGPSMICPQAHDDRAFLLNEITRLRARVEVLEDALREIADHHSESKMTRALVRFVGLEAKP
jgi:hypothetical protein